MVTELPGAALLDLGDELFKLANELIAKYERANEAPINKAAADKIVELVFEDEADKDKAEVLRGHLYSAIKRQGVPTSDQAEEVLEEAAQVKARNEATGLKTQELILAREWASLMTRSSRDFTPTEYMVWQNQRANKSDQIAMLPPKSQAAIYAEAAAIVERGDAAA